jgi:hypothetical protein
VLCVHQQSRPFTVDMCACFACVCNKNQQGALSVAPATRVYMPLI